MNSKKLLQWMFVFILIALLLSGCGPGQMFGPTQTPIPPTSTNTPIPPTATSTSTPVPPTATPKIFSIQGADFEASYKDDCSTDVQINSVDGTSFGVGGTLSMRNGQWVLWCYSAKHTWIGTLTYAGYVFESSENEPLQFIVTSDGYKYVSGNGTVTSPDGSVTTLP
jgi:hypothetical protein